MKYQNPVIPGFYPDPSVCRVGADFYLVTSSFEYFPGVPIFHSRDLVTWRQLGHCLDRPSQLKLDSARASGGIYAPTIRHRDGTFYMTTTNTSHRGNFIVTATDPRGPWSDPIWVEQEGIDPSLFFDDEGSVYFSSASGGALQSTIDVRTGQLLSTPKRVWQGTGGQYPEGPHLYRRGPWYYLLLSEGGTEFGHMVTMARSKSPWGPFEACAQNPLLTHRSYRSPIQMTGHLDLVDALDGSFWAVLLGTRPNGYPPCYHLGRETFLTPVRWPEDDFPSIGNAGRVELEMECSLAREGGERPPERDDFEAQALAPCWNFLRNPDAGSFSLRERPGFLRLHGSDRGLDDVASPAWVGRRQCHFALQVRARLTFDPQAESEEAGLVVRMNETHHYEIFVSLRSGRRNVVVRRRIGSLRAEVASQPLTEAEGDSVVLGVAADRSSYVFLFGPSEGTLRPLAQGETRYLSTEVAGGFTGVYLAMYASGNGTACSGPADFDWFDYRELEDKAAPSP